MIKIFNNILEGVFVNRKNRFLVECLIDGKKVNAYLPNPGRLFELLYKGVKIYLVENLNLGNLKYTVIGVKKNNAPVMLHTHFSNKIVKLLLEKKLLKGFEEFKVVADEYKVNKCRFDFLLEKDGINVPLEVKTCTLFHDSIAMFPDAVTQRGVKHLKELALSDGSLIFFIQSKNVSYFLPEFNVDFEFAKTFLELRDKIFIKAYAIGWRDDFSLDLNDIKEVKIPWCIIKKHIVDSGSYFLILRIERDKKIKVGELGEILFKKGHYVYVGSGKKNLSKRVERHKRLIKNKFWHIDYLREKSIYVSTLLFRTERMLECELADKLRNISDWNISNFGSSDCICDGHLFGFVDNPINYASFREIILHYRMGILKEELKDLLEII